MIKINENLYSYCLRAKCSLSHIVTSCDLKAPFLNFCCQDQFHCFLSIKHHQQRKWVHYNTMSTFYSYFLPMIQWNSNEDVLMHDSNCGLARVVEKIDIFYCAFFCQ